MRLEPFNVGNVLNWTILTRDPDTLELKDANSNPTVSVRRFGVAVGDSVTVIKRPSTVGLYDCTYNPASEVDGEPFEFLELVNITGTSTPARNYHYSWNTVARAPYVAPDNANIVSAATNAANAVTAANTAATNANTAATNASTAATNAANAVTAANTAATNAANAVTAANAAATSAGAAATNTTTLLSRITAGAAQLFVDLAAMLVGSTTANVQYTAKALELAPGSSGGLTPSQQDQLDNIEAKCNLFEQPVGSYLLTVSGTYLCLRSDVELVYGVKNVSAWADLDNGGNATFITNRISTMIALADNEIRSRLAEGPYTLPGTGETIPPLLVYHTAALAGVLLYESRGVLMNEEGQVEHLLAPFRKRVMSFISDVNANRLTLSGLVRKNDTNTAPEIIAD